MTTTDNMNSIYSFLKSKGLNDGAIAGIMGNIQQESGFNPSITNGIGAFGLAQWLGSRKTALQNYAKKTGQDPSSLTAQENFLWSEISSGKEGVNVQTLNTMNASQAAAYIDQKYERPGSKDTSLGTRESNATSIYNQIQNGKITASASSSSGDTSGLTDTSFGLPTAASIGKIVQQGLGILVGAGIIFMGLYIAMNPLSDLSSAIYSLGKK